MQGRQHSTPLRQEIALLSVAVLVFGLVALWQRFELTFSPSLPLSLVPVGLGVAFGVGLVFAFSVREHGGKVSEDKPRQFVVVFAIALVGQVGLFVVPTETLLLAMAGFGSAIPARLFVYWQYQR